MQKALIVLGVFVVILLIGAFSFKHFVGDVRPALLPAADIGDQKADSVDKMNSQNQQILDSSGGKDFQLQTVPFNLKIPDGYKIGIFGHESGARDLAFSEEGVLVVSSPSLGEVVAFAVLGSGKVEKKTVISGLRKPHGIAFKRGKLFIAEENRLGRYNWDSSSLQAKFEKELFKLPTGGHAAHTLVFDKSDNLFVKVGSSCNVCNETDPWRATVIKTDFDGNSPQVYAKGLRNAAFMTLNQASGEIWATENGRDNLGDNLPPEEINIIQHDKNYGWPSCYGEKIHDTSFDKKTYIRNPCEDTQVGAYLMQAHSAPLGLSFIPESFATDFKGDLLVAFHGSWNRSEPTGYKVVKLNVEGGKVTEQSDFMSGCLQGAQANCRPVDVEFDKNGNLFISDDKGGNVFVVSKK